MRFQPRISLVLLALALAPSMSGAAELETLSAMHQTNTPVDWPTIPQTGAKADQIYLPTHADS